MKLPKPDFPKYEAILPISKKAVEYRPYTSKEEKIILMAASTKDDNEIEKAAMQVMENCASVDLLKLHPVDVEFLYLKLYIASVSRTTDVDFPVECGSDPSEDAEGNIIECSGYVDAKVDLEKDVELRGEGILEEAGYTRKGESGWLVPISDEAGIVFNLLSSVKEDQYEVLFDAFQCIYMGEEVTGREDVTLEEFKEWIDDLPRPVADRIDFLFENQPYLVASFKGTCSVCGKEHKREVGGVLDFLG